MLLFGSSFNPVGSRIASGHDEYAFSTNALLIEQMDRTLVVCIKRHGDAYSYRERHGSATKAMESTDYLENYDAANMRRVAQRAIKLDDNEKTKKPQINGTAAEKKGKWKGRAG